MAWLIAAGPVVAATFTVDSLADPTEAGHMTLRDAIIAANAAGGEDFIEFDATVFAPAGGPYTIQLESSLPDLTDATTITGPGAALLTLRGRGADGGNFRIITVAATGAVSFVSLTFANGRVQNDGTDGTSSTQPTAGAASMGGAVLNHGAMATYWCVFTGNVAQGGRGGNGARTYSQNGADAADGFGGAIYSDGATLVIRGTTFIGNHAGGGTGGGGSSQDTGTLGNGGAAGDGYGGAIYAPIGRVQLEAATFTWNTARGGTGGSGGSYSNGITGVGAVGGKGVGGAVHFTDAGAGWLSVAASTMALNAAIPGQGGFSGNIQLDQRAANGTASAGGWFLGVGAQGVLCSTLIAANTVQTSFVPDPNTYLYPTQESDVVGAFTTQAFNLIGETDSATGFDAYDQTGTVAAPIDPKVDPNGAADNGGKVPTLRLRKGSRALDRGYIFGIAQIYVDARGFPRPVNLNNAIYPDAAAGGGDVGAYEAQSLPNDLPVITNATTSIYGTQGTDITTVNFSTSGTAPGTNNQLVATDADNDPLTFSLVSGTMPAGLTLNADGSITGTPTAASQASITYKVNDGMADSATATLNFSIRETASLVVNTDSDDSTAYDGLTSLREAVAYASDGGMHGTTVTFDPTFFDTPKTITIATNLGAISIAGTCTIEGSAAGVTISGGRAQRIMTVFSFGDAMTVTLQNLTLAHGQTGVNSAGGAMNLSYIDLGGGIRPIVALTGCTLYNNASDDGGGGAIANDGAQLTLSNCTLVANHADKNGTSTIGGAIYQGSGSATILNCTITQNRATSGGGIGIGNAGGTVTLGNSIVSGNFATTGPDLFGTFATQGYNLIGDTSGATVTATTGDQFNVSAGLDAGGLTDLGGPTMTIALAAGSNALDKGKALGAVTTDQRGQPRPFDDSDVGNASGGDGSDIGAYEVQAPPDADLAITVTDGVTTATPGGSVIYTITASNAGPASATATVTDTFPASLTAEWTAVGAGGGTVTAHGSGNINESVTLPAGGSVTFTVSATISAAATGALSNTAAITSATSDPTPANNSATDTDTLTPQADLSVTLTDGVTNAPAGGSVIYTLTASNAGPSNAPGATVADTFPATLGSISWTAVGVGGGTVTANGNGNISEVVNLPAGGSVTFTVSATLSGSASGTLSNTATVAAPGGVTDPSPGNNSATDLDTILVKPTVTSPSSASIGKTSATLGGTVSSDGGAEIWERGVVYAVTSVNASPVIGDTGVVKVPTSGTTGVFTVPATGLTWNTSYSFAPYAINAVGTTYGSVSTFSTLPPSTNALLAGLAPSAGTLSPAFDPAAGSYTSTVASAVSAITLTPTVQDPTATIRVNGSVVASGAASGAIPLVVGNNTLAVLVTAEDGATTRSYSIVIHRPSANADLASLVSSGGALTPAFSAGVAAYYQSIGNLTTGVTITPTVAEAHATVRVRSNGGSYAGVASGSASATLAMNVGENLIELLVTAEDGSTRTYALTVTRLEPTGVAINLSGLSVAYNGQPKPVTVTTTPANIAYEVKYNGQATPPTTAGRYAVTVTITAPGYTGSATGSLEITNLPATITLGNLTQTYNGLARPVTAVTDPANLPVTITYDGIPIAPVLPGAYAVVATIADPSYSGAASGTLVVKFAQTISVTQPSDKTTSDPAFDLAASASSPLPVTFTILSGPATLSGTRVFLTGTTGLVTVRASQAGNSDYFAAPDVIFTFNVLASTGRGYTGWGVSPSAGPRPAGHTPQAMVQTGQVAAYLPGGSSSGSILFLIPDAGIQELVSFTLTQDSVFTFSATRKVGDSRTTVSGHGQLDGDTLSGSFDDIGLSFTTALEPSNGPSASVQGIYQSTALNGGEGRTYTFIGANNNVVVLVVTPTQTLGGTATLQNNGSFTVNAGTASIAAAINPSTTTVTTVVTATGQTPVVFGGLKATTMHTDRLINISSRARVGNGEKILISGFVIGGSYAKPVLIRAAGPALAPMGVNSVLPNPTIRIIKNGEQLAQNDDWGASADPAATAAVAGRLGAFAFTPGSKDAALLVTLQPGIYSALVSGGEGVSLVEIYDASENPQADFQRLVNISARGDVGFGENILIGGFVITGNAPKKVLIRGVGPTLGTQGVGAPLADPLLKVFRGGTQIAENDNWSTDANAAAAMVAAATKSGAFALPSGSKDAAVLLTLAPGLYSAQVMPVTGTVPGVALVEVYEVPE